MKYKEPIESAGLTKEHSYLGHFTKAKHINRGHNSDPMPEDEVPNRNHLISLDDKNKQVGKIPNVYRGDLQPDFESGNSLPEVYDSKKPIET